jgi:uncharacterized membrane protein (DUF485 family)
MIWRVAGGVVLGLALYWLLFLALGVSFGLVWPDYRDAARVMMQERSFRLFTLPMFLANFVVFAVAGYAAGWLSTRISKTTKSATATTAILLVYAVTEHYILLWNQLPDWYNLTIPLVIAGSFWLGGRASGARQG